ncbi:MAG: HAMP domain-containing protein [Deltaproteobacteria bacterium]|nr:HAMP domain-containing protein [Deltaproteobacteria bacterium]
MAVGAAATLVIALALHFFLVDAEKRHLLQRKEQAARTLAASMKLPFTQILLYEETGLVAESGLLDLYISRMAGNRDMHVSYAMVLDPEGHVLSHSDLTQFHKRLDDPLSRKALAATGMILSSVGDPFEGGVIDVATPLNVSSKRFGTLRLGYSLSGLAEEIRGLKRKVLVLTISAAALMIFFLFVAARVMARPIRRLVNALNSVHLGRLEPMPLPERNDELGDLQDSYRIMVDRLRKEEIERVKTRELLARTEKMATIGTLAAGIAHEINSPLTGAMHSIGALAKESLPPRKRDRYLKVAGESLERIRRAVSQLLDYSTVHATNFSECDLSRLVADTLELLHYQIGRSGIEVENRLPPLAVRGDAHKLEQVLVNIVMNAIAAMPSGGRLEFSHAEDGSSLTLIIADTGEGIPEENHGRIFEPFFTTKGNGKGTGLGLAVCRKIVEQHDGKISVSSRPGEGAKFFITLPRPLLMEGTHGR